MLNEKIEMTIIDAIPDTSDDPGPPGNETPIEKRIVIDAILTLKKNNVIIKLDSPVLTHKKFTFSNLKRKLIGKTVLTQIEYIVPISNIDLDKNDLRKKTIYQGDEKFFIEGKIIKVEKSEIIDNKNNNGYR